eukprot:9469188-Pyramimonas_sp.AAC.1
MAAGFNGIPGVAEKWGSTPISFHRPLELLTVERLNLTHRVHDVEEHGIVDDGAFGLGDTVVNLGVARPLLRGQEVDCLSPPSTAAVWTRLRMRLRLRLRLWLCSRGRRSEAPGRTAAAAAAEKEKGKLRPHPLRRKAAEEPSLIEKPLR